MQVGVRKRAITHRALLRKMTSKDKASYESSPFSIQRLKTNPTYRQVVIPPHNKSYDTQRLKIIHSASKQITWYTAPRTNPKQNKIPRINKYYTAPQNKSRNTQCLKFNPKTKKSQEYINTTQRFNTNHVIRSASNGTHIWISRDTQHLMREQTSQHIIGEQSGDTAHCNTLQFNATHCNTLQHVFSLGTLQHTATYCNTLQHTVTRCNTLQ